MRRTYHSWDKWECFLAGFYESSPPGTMTPDDALRAYADFLRDTPRFRVALERVITEWKFSCEHFLSNPNINRIAWLGQSSMCMDTRVPACFRGGFNRLSAAEQSTANATAAEYLGLWMVRQGESSVCDGFALVADTEPVGERFTGSARGTRGRVVEYEQAWMSRDYSDGIPDAVPLLLMRQGIAPSYEAVCHALLKNDVGLYSLGFQRPVSPWYGALKHIELSGRRGTAESMQMVLFR